MPLTFDTSAFYAQQAILGMILLVALAAFGLRTSLAGQPVLGGLLEDSRLNRKNDASV